jgi:hypothetical protein
MTGTLTEALLAVHDILAKARVAHALCGGLAANLYRDEVRATSDVDIAVSVGAARLVDLMKTFTEAGWRAEPHWRKGEQLRLSHPDVPRVDCIIATTDYERTAIARAASMEVGGRTLRVLTAEDLIVFKLVAGRARDYEAVAAIINAHGEALDTEYVTGWLEQFELEERWPRALEEAHREAE